MTVLAETARWLVEYDQAGGHRMLTICCKITGAGKALFGPSIAGDFRDAVKKYGVDRSIETYLRAMARDNWTQIYKPLVLLRRPL